MTSYGKEVTIVGGDYGWWMDYEQEAVELAEMIENGESGERTPVYFQTAASYETPDYGNTYVEINLTAQHLFLYKDGEKILESDFVSGNASRGYDTPAGAYSITYKQRDATLTGENYRTPVSYWMPFNRNIGMHDANWRGSLVEISIRPMAPMAASTFHLQRLRLSTKQSRRELRLSVIIFLAQNLL